MTKRETAELRADFIKAIEQTIDVIGLDALKRMSWFGSNDPAFFASKTKRAA